MLAVCHTYYSLNAGVRSPGDWVRVAAERGYKALAVADVEGLYGAVEFYQAAEAAGIRALVGALFCAGDGCEVTVLVMSQAGYGKLCRMLTRRHLDPDFGFHECLAAEGVDGLLCLTRSIRVYYELCGVVGKNDVYLLPSSQQVSGTLWDAVCWGEGRELSVPDAWFLEASDREVFDWLGTLRGLSGGPALTVPEYPGVVLPSVDDWGEQFPGGAGVVEEILERCEFRFDFERVILPRLELPGGVAGEANLRELCEQGLESCYEEGKRVEARARLEYELKVISANGFVDYFLYVYEIVSFARGRGILVEVRGSAASSIVTYLLGFTHCCPLEHDLYFERFMNPGRQDLPDIDVDIADVRRDEVVEFCYRRWGESHVAMLATVQRYRYRAAVRAAGRVLGMPLSQVKWVLDGKGDVSGQDELLRVASRLVGLPRHLGVHCGGLVITPGPVTDVVPLTRSARGMIVTHFEKEQAEAVGLVKMDLLGNSALSVIEETGALLMRRGLKLPDPGPVYDFKVNRLFAAGDTLGVYQCESPGMRQMCRSLLPSNRKEVAAALSLIRPGPAAAGMKDVFIRRCRGLEKVEYLHPRMRSFLKGTYGVMLYQEDVMKVAVNVFGYTPGEADSLRRIVKGRSGYELDVAHTRFVQERGVAAGLSIELSERLWQHVTQFGSYSFCKAHAAVYGRLAWITACLKVRYPREFYTAVLNVHKSMYPKRVFVWDAIRHGIPVLPVDVCNSRVEWSAEHRGIRAGLGVVRGLRRRLCGQIVEERSRLPFAGFQDFCGRIEFKGGELETLIMLGACRSWGGREELLGLLQNDRAGYDQQPLLFPDPTPSLPDQMEVELALTGIPFCRHPVDVSASGQCRSGEMGSKVGCYVSMTGIMDAVKYTSVAGRDGQRRMMSFVTLEDATGLFEVVLFPDQHERLSEVFVSGMGPYWVRGVVAECWGSVTLEALEAGLQVRARP